MVGYYYCIWEFSAVPVPQTGIMATTNDNVLPPDTSPCAINNIKSLGIRQLMVNNP